MRAYECVYILDPALEETAVKEKADRFSEIVTSRKGAVSSIDHWGKRKLAYPINKSYEGIYAVMKFTGDTEILNELNRVFRFDDLVLRHLIVVADHPEPAPEKNEATDAGVV
jgi:small subunit ribosomal protein S6